MLGFYLINNSFFFFTDLDNSRLVYAYRPPCVYIRIPNTLCVFVREQIGRYLKEFIRINACYKFFFL